MALLIFKIMKRDKYHIDKIFESLQNGDGRVRACKNAGISYQCFINWCDDVEFFELIKKAENTGNDKIKDICKRRIIEDKSWQSAAWWLERNFKNEYSLKQEFDHTTKGESLNKISAIEVIHSNENTSK